MAVTFTITAKVTRMESQGAESCVCSHQSCSVPSRKLLSRSFRAWRRLSQRHQARAEVVAQNRRRLIQKSLRLLLWLREARLEAAWGQRAEALPAWSFQEVGVL